MSCWFDRYTLTFFLSLKTTWHYLKFLLLAKHIFFDSIKSFSYFCQVFIHTIVIVVKLNTVRHEITVKFKSSENSSAGSDWAYCQFGFCLQCVWDKLWWFFNRLSWYVDRKRFMHLLTTLTPIIGYQLESDNWVHSSLPVFSVSLSSLLDDIEEISWPTFKVWKMCFGLILHFIFIRFLSNYIAVWSSRGILKIAIGDAHFRDWL